MERHTSNRWAVSTDTKTALAGLLQHIPMFACDLVF
jgi:hypothetical protein